MNSSLQLRVFLLMVALLSFASAQEDYCNGQESLIVTIPTQFTARYRVLHFVDDGTEIVYDAEETFDALNHKIAIILERPGEFLHIVHDINTKQLMIVANNSICSVDEIDDSEFYLYDDETYSIGMLLRQIPTNNRVCKCGSVDGISTCKLNTSIPIHVNMKDVNLEASFSVNDWQFPNWSEDEANNWNRPVRLELNGFQIGDRAKMFINTYIILDFKTTINSEMFQIPPGVSCEDMEKQVKPIVFPLFHFNVDVEVYRNDKQTGDSEKRMIEIAADGDAKVFRQDERVVTSNEFLPDYVTYITDTSTDMLYVFDKHTGRCAAAFATNEPDFQNPHYSYEMINEILFDNQNMSKAFYIGTRTCRTGKCNVYSISKGDKTLEVYVPYYPGLEFSIPIMATVTYIDDHKQLVLESTTHYFNFESKLPKWSLFDVSACFEDQHLLRFQVTLKGQIDAIESEIGSFERDFVRAVCSVTENGIALTRINKIQVDSIFDDYIVITATLIEDPGNAGLHKNSKYKMETVPSNREVLNTLAEKVFAGNFSISMMIINKNSTTIIELTGEDVTDEISSGNEDKFTDAVLQKYKQNINLCINFGEVVSVADISVDRCASMCEADNIYDCKTFVYCPATGSCKLYPKHFELMKKTDISKSDECAIYERKFEDDFSKSESLKMIGFTLNVSKADFDDACFIYCDELSEGINKQICESFDVCQKKTEAVCTFHTQSADLVSFGQLERDSSCQLYSREYLDLFLMMNNLQYTSTDWIYIEVPSTSATSCATMCILDPNGCTDFEMRSDNEQSKTRTTCYLMRPKPGVVNPGTSSFSTKRTGHYKLKNPRPIPAPLTSTTSSSSITTESSSMPTTTIQVIYEYEEVEGYSSGAMAGVGIAMIILGVILGMGISYIIAKKRITQHQDDISLRIIGSRT